MLKYPHLFSPIKVGNVVFRNRIFASPTGYTDIKSDYTLGEQAIAYYERKASGGAASVCIGECQIDPPNSSRGGRCIDLSNPMTLNYMGRIADRITRRGAVASAELQHCGRYGGCALAPSSGDVDGRECYEMTEQQILDTISAYGTAALNAKERGFNMVTVHGGHGWLPEQFFSRTTNSRTDSWGGSLENRARFAVAVCDEIHRRCGRGFPVEFRISAVETEFGYGLDEGIEYAMALDGHADIIHVSSGVHGTLMHDNWVISAPGMFSEEGELVKYAAAIKPHIKKSLVGTVGSLTDPAMMEDIIASGKADFVNIARGLLCDPDLPNKARAGRDDEIRTCIRCMSCWSSLRSGGIYCALNPRTSREAELDVPAPEHENMRVAVIGGGPAGMQAALTAAECGHSVTLYEKSGELGGALACEKNVPFKSHLEKYIAFMAKNLEKAGADVRLMTEATPERLEAE
ncbi:MAG: FAD-dependent oxidoreductase, partial [Oscillospiraceae bacterium]|nr:FAD-dependent oxidoreductase [Oscillospiraceae bacterium]